MKRLLFSLLVLGAIGMIGCDKEEDAVGTLDLNFKAHYGNENLVMLNKYDYDTGIKVLFQRFNFYISDLRLIKDGEEEMILDIEYVNFDEVDTEARAEEGVTIRIPEIEVGDYDVLQIGLGVPPDLNATVATDYPDDHPLGRDSHYWSAWQSYIFTMINGKVDTNGDGIYDDSSILYHAGSDETYRVKNITLPIKIQKDNITTLILDVDLHQLFRDGNGYIDILEHPNTHDIEDLEIANQVMDNFQEALVLVE